MPLRRRLRFSVYLFTEAISSFALPSWVTGAGVRVALMLVIAIIGVSYVAKTNTSAKTGFEMRALEDQVSDLQNEVQKMNVAIAEASALRTVQNRVKNLDMVSGVAIRSFIPRETQVASNR